ncbi:monocarboxylate transporter 13-like [Patiria miniata]|uniref:Major facilitator superfamily (MFS) profile domain-containing protein n=1 Tax=Patiria miniata TaxID=46514 RepID=A0A914A9P8_PATMI|nr:monocarboxylate transporter 13-like [Patiria miniata]
MPLCCLVFNETAMRADFCTTCTTKRQHLTTDAKSAMAIPQTCLRRWHWVITLATFTLYFLVLGPMFNFSILYLSLQGEFKSAAAITGWLGSLSAALARLFSPVTVLLEQRLSKRAVTLIGLVLYCTGLLTTSFVPALGYAFITYGVLSGVGANLTLHSSLQLLLEWFAKGNFARASAIALLGSTGGLLAFSPLLTVLITNCGWRNALRVLSGGIFVVGIADGLLLTDPPTTEDIFPRQNRSEDTEQNEHDMQNVRKRERADESCEQENEGKERTELLDDAIVSSHEGSNTKPDWCEVWRMMQSLELWLWSVANFLTFLGWTFFDINFASYMDGLNLHSNQISYVIMGFAGGEIGGKLLIALLGGRLPFKYLYVVVSSCLLAAVPLGLMTIVKTFAAIMPIAVASGFLRSGAYGVLYAAGAELFLEKYGPSTVMVLTLVPPGFGILVSAPLSGSLFDVTGSYFASLLVIAAIFVCASAAFLFIPVRRKIRSGGSCYSSASRDQQHELQYPEGQCNQVTM